MPNEQRNITFHSSLGSRPADAPSRVRRDESAFRFRSEDPRSRLASLALFYALGFTLAYGVGTVAHVGLCWRLFTHLPFVVALVCILSAVAIFVLARWRLVPERILTRIALVWLAPAVLGILVAENWIWVSLKPDVFETIVEQRTSIGISWSCVVISIFPLLVRASVLQVALSSFAAAAMGPLYLLALSWFYDASIPDMALFGMSFPLFVCAGVAMMCGAVVVRYRQDMDKARQLGSYRLEKLLGKGGMGEVWLARHHMLVRPAAIKLIRPQALGSPRDGDSPESHLLRRFEREVQATASLKSPHTISVYDFGTTDAGSFYYVMELLDGLDTQSLVERFGPVPEARAIHLLAQACASLEEAHHVGLVHRDVKPANIFVCRHGLDLDFVKILDFGLVKTVEDAKREESNLTAEGVATGTPAYMAPEVAMARPEMDGRLDIYALGCVAYWLVTGQEVFEADSPMALVLRHVRDDPVPPSRRSELDLSPEFERLILLCLEKEPANRPQSATELAKRLQELSGYGKWNRSQAQSWWDRHLPESVSPADPGPAP